MIRNPVHRSSALRVLIVGALAVLLGSASAAWACSPGANIVFYGNQQEVVAGEPVTVSGEEYEEGATIEIRMGDTAEAARTGPVKATVTGPRFVTTVVLDALGPNTIWSFVVNSAGARTLPNETGTMKTIRVTEAASSTGPSSTIQPTTTVPRDDPGNNNGVSRPPTSPETKVPVLDRSRAVTAPGAAPAARSVPAARSPAASPRVDRAASAPAAPTASAPAVLDGTPPSGLVPDVRDLWSGIDRLRAPTLLDGADIPASGRAPQAGVVLLGCGLLALAAAGAVAGKRRLALARGSRG